MQQPIDQKAREDALDLRCSIAVRAPAGSGKTELLVQRFLACLSITSRPERVLALTFSVAAAAEMKRRVMDAVQAAAGSGGVTESKSVTQRLAHAVVRRDREQGWNLVGNPHRLRVMTIDSLNAALASQLPLLTGVGSSLQVDDRPRLLYEEAVYGLLAEYDQDATPANVGAAIEALLRCADYRYDRLAPMLGNMLARREQWIGALHEADPMWVEGALDEWIRARLHEFTSTAADWLPRIDHVIRLAAHHDPAWVNQWGFESVPAEEPAAVDRWRSLGDLFLTQAGTLRARVNVKQGFPAKADPTVAMNELLAGLAASEEATEFVQALCRVRALPDPAFPESMIEFRGALVTALDRLCAHLLLAFESCGRVDFPELAARAIRALGQDTPTEVLMRLDYNIEHLLVDEFQDTNRSQLRLFSRLTEAWAEGDGRTLFFVGDPQQSIFLFREAEVRLFVSILEREAFEQIPLKVVSLQQNFRSDKVPVAWCNQAFEHVFPRHTDPLIGSVPFTPARAIHEEGDGLVEVVPALERDDDAEAQSIIERIRHVHGEDPEASIAILVRSRSHLRSILPALFAAGIDYSANDIDPIAERGAVEDVVHLVRAIRHPADRLSWLRVLRSRVVGLTFDDIVTLLGHCGSTGAVRDASAAALEAGDLRADARQRVRALLDVLAEVEATPAFRASFADLVRAVWMGLGGQHAVDAQEAVDVERVFARLAEVCTGGILEDMRAFVVALEGLYATPRPGGVQVMTIHAAKGLEFDAVLLAGLGRQPRHDDEPLFYHHALPSGFLLAPHPGPGPDSDEAAATLFRAARTLQQEALEAEARRLLYVGLTRARRWMYLFGHATPAKAASAHKEPRPRPDKGSLLSFLWSYVASIYQTTCDAGERDPEPTGGACNCVSSSVPRALRLPGDATVEMPRPIYVPPRNRAVRPSEMTESGRNLDDRLTRRRLDARVAGVLYHALMERIGTDGVRQWPLERVRGLFGHLVARAREEGLAGARAQAVAQRTLGLIERTVEDETGRWILTDHPGARRELALSGIVNGQRSSLVIDAVLPTSEAVWVIDHKSIDLPDDPAAMLAAMRTEVERYREQLVAYVEALARSGLFAGPFRAGLYFPTATASQTLNACCSHSPNLCPLLEYRCQSHHPSVI